MLTASCSSGALSLLTGAGPNIAANTQAGQTNTQTIGTTTNVSPTVTVRPKARVQTIDQSLTETKLSSENTEKITFNETPPWLIIALVLWSIFLWQLPSPNQLKAGFVSLFKKI